MKALELFERRRTVVELLLFAYAVTVGSLVCIHMPIIFYSALPLLAVGLLLGTYSLWWLSTPLTKRSRLYLGLAFAGMVGLVVFLYAFSSEIAAFSVLKLHNSVTESLRREHRDYLLEILLIYTVVAAGTAAVFYRLFSLNKPGIIRTFALLWGAIPVLFLFMKFYGIFLPLT